MGREIRRVPPNWEHPKRMGRRGEEYIPLFDRSYSQELAKWTENNNLWLEGKHPAQLSDPSRVERYRFYAV